MQNFKMYFKFDSDYSDEETENTLWYSKSFAYYTLTTIQMSQTHFKAMV